MHTGSIATYLDPGCLATAALLDAYRTSATITYDPNVRPALIDNREQAIERITRMVEKADIVKASEEDLQWIDPQRDYFDIAQTWLSLGPSIVAVTRGEQGVFAVGRHDSNVHVKVNPASAVVDTVGAGDSFMTALIDILWSMSLLGADRRSALPDISQGSLEHMMIYASRAAAVTVTRAGADLPDRAALKQG